MQEMLRDAGSIPGWGTSPGEGNGNLLQYSCPESPMDRGAWQARVHGVSPWGHTVHGVTQLSRADTQRAPCLTSSRLEDAGEILQRHSRAKGFPSGQKVARLSKQI